MFCSCQVLTVVNFTQYVLKLNSELDLSEQPIIGEMVSALLAAAVLQVIAAEKTKIKLQGC